MTLTVAAALAALWVLVLCRLPRLLGSRPDVISMAALAGALGSTISLTSVYTAVDTWLGLLNISTAISGALVMLAFGLFRTAIVNAVVEPELRAEINRRGMKWTTVAITVFVVSFFCAMFTGSTGVSVNDVMDHHDVGVFVFSATFCLFLASVGVSVAQVSVKYVPSMSSKLFRAGFILVTMGCFAGLAALAMKAVRQILILTGNGAEAASVFQALFENIGSTGTVLFVSGLILPSVSRQVTQLDLWSRFRLVSLHAIWRRCARINSNVVLDHASSPIAAAFGKNPAPRLHRTLVEILDSHLVCRGQLLTPNELKKVRKTEEKLYVAN